MNQFSKLYFCLISDKDYIIHCKAFYSEISNFSDHILLMLTCLCCKPVLDTITVVNTNAKSKDNSTVIHLRLDHTDLTRYYNYTGQELQSILNTINSSNSKLYSGVSSEVAASFVLVSGVSQEGTVDCHSGVSPGSATTKTRVSNFVNGLYSNVVDVLHCGANQFVPSHKNLFLQILVEPRTGNS